MVFIAYYLRPQHDMIISILNSPSVSGHGTPEEVIILTEVPQTEKCTI